MATRPSKLPLHNRRILVCRPQPEANRLAASLRHAGAVVKTFPMIERAITAETPSQRTLVQHLDLFQHIIAVSPFAAEQLLARADTWWPQLPIQLHWYGVGAATAAVFTHAGLSPHQPDQGFTSEQLLALPTLATPSGDKVLLAKGEQGRDLIRTTLEHRGAQVSELALYQRRRPDYTQTDIDDALVRFNPDAIITLSMETLNNLIALSKNTNHNLEQCLLVVPAERVADQARHAGFNRVCLPDSLHDDAIVTCIADHLASPSHDTADSTTAQ
ncbi:uroporphyrinogen-III synthase [Marinobacter caseinilyticus]|uniref:uroporphyrinogen-III synthase n=1 Tax=Marinobacter caseinilyticus TaxID=2692195 RepID=UPI00140AC911|nr:uroporphyrinogen-III synthase [Marinobacter caseinilyticus]